MRNIARNEVITVEEWRRLPWLLPRGIAMMVTGLSSDELSEEVNAGRLHVYRSSAVGKAKFFKSELAALCRLPGALPEVEAAFRSWLEEIRHRLTGDLGANRPLSPAFGGRPVAKSPAPGVTHGTNGQQQKRKGDAITRPNGSRPGSHD